MEPSPTHSFFETVSKIVIILPVALILIALVTQVNLPSISSQSKKKALTVSVTPLPTIPVQEKGNGVPLNLQGPSLCTGQNDTTAVSAMIKNKNIYAEVTQDAKKKYFLLNGDCLYQWQDGSRSGKKTCDMNQYLTIAETMASFNLLTTDSLVTIIASMPTDDSAKKSIKTDYQNLKPVCEPAEINDSTFTIPRNVTFKLAPTAPIVPTTDY